MSNLYDQIQPGYDMLDSKLELRVKEKMLSEGIDYRGALDKIYWEQQANKPMLKEYDEKLTAESVEAKVYKVADMIQDKHPHAKDLNNIEVLTALYNLEKDGIDCHKYALSKEYDYKKIIENSTKGNVNHGK